MSKLEAKTRLTFRADPKKPLTSDNELVIEAGETFTPASHHNVDKMLKRGIVERAVSRRSARKAIEEESIG